MLIKYEFNADIVEFKSVDKFSTSCNMLLTGL